MTDSQPSLRASESGAVAQNSVGVAASAWQSPGSEIGVERFLEGD
jgi:hypothetical protein